MNVLGTPDGVHQMETEFFPASNWLSNRTAEQNMMMKVLHLFKVHQTACVQDFTLLGCNKLIDFIKMKSCAVMVYK